VIVRLSVGQISAFGISSKGCVELGVSSVLEGCLPLAPASVQTAKVKAEIGFYNAINIWK
jgi:hypothetical protein